MIGPDVLYGVGGIVAVALFAYLVFALIRAEAF
ncbi:K(+)-transporting ATPase subunit F [Variovorax sp. PvP013]|jgi:K+-transporting ATPase ATPase F chain